jgi:hypothetical protein
MIILATFFSCFRKVTLCFFASSLFFSSLKKEITNYFSPSSLSDDVKYFHNYLFNCCFQRSSQLVFSPHMFYSFRGVYTHKRVFHIFSKLIASFSHCTLSLKRLSYSSNSHNVLLSPKIFSLLP